jgi:hypothetical protein
MWVEAACLGFYVLSATVGIRRYSSLRHFLTETPSISDETSIALYRRLARNQTFLLYIGLALLLGGMMTGVVTLVRHGVVGLIAMVLVNGTVLGIGFQLRGLEKKVRGIPSGTDNLGLEYQRVTESWTKNTFS